MIYVFFGIPGAGKTALCDRFARLHGFDGIDTDHFMTAEERAAVVEGRYTRAMRLENIRRYCAAVNGSLETAGREHDVALADGLPNDEARRLLLDLLPAGLVRLILVQTERGLWERRLDARSGNLVELGVAEANAYVASAWEPVDPSIPHVILENGADDAALDARLRELRESTRPA